MVAQVNEGCVTPVLARCSRRGNIEWFWVLWDLPDGVTVLTSTWRIPTGFTELDDVLNGSVTDEDGTVYDPANAIQLETTTTVTDDSYQIDNVITTSAGETLTEGFILNVEGPS